MQSSFNMSHLAWIKAVPQLKKLELSVRLPGAHKYYSAWEDDCDTSSTDCASEIEAFFEGVPGLEVEVSG
jgi:hypothetical protein